MCRKRSGCARIGMALRPVRQKMHRRAVDAALSRERLHNHVLPGSLSEVLMASLGFESGDFKETYVGKSRSRHRSRLRNR
jgi:hypothetical protein